MKSFSNQPYRLFSWTLAGLLLLLVLLEGWRYMVKPDADNKNQIASAALNMVANDFFKSQQQLLSQSQALANTLQNQLEKRRPRQELFESLQKYPQFWGSSLYQDTEPIVWNDFSLEPFEDILSPDRTDSYVQVQKKGNVLLWVAHVSFEIPTKNGSLLYHLYTARRIRQTNALSIATDREFNMLQNIPRSKNATVNLGIYENISPDTVNYRVLRTLSNDSVGIAYANPNDTQQVVEKWQAANQFWRALYALLCFVIIGSALYLWLNKLVAWKSLFFQLLIVCISWIVFNQIHIAENWLPALLQRMRATDGRSYQMLCNFAIDGLFFLITAWTLRRKLSILEFKLHPTNYFSAIFAALFTGVINIIAIVLTLKSCYNLAYSISFPLLSLKVFPGTGIILFYLCLGIILLALTVALLAVNHFLLASCADYYKLVTIITVSSFIAGLFLVQIFVTELFILNWAFIISVIYFGMVFIFAFTHFRFPYTIPATSPLRNAAIYSLIISLAGSTVIYRAKKNHIDSELTQTVQKYTQQNDLRAQQLTQDILSNLQQEFLNLTENDIRERLSYVQSRFNQTIEASIPEKSRIYSFDLQMIDNDEDLLAGYSTSLNSPNWVNSFNLKRLRTIIGIQQITSNTIKPYVQQPELVNAADYQTFYRGWIPIFESGEKEPIAWILCSVYRERPDFNKPMRAVMASITYQDWENSYLIQQYNNKRLTKTIYEGIEAHYPVFNMLQPAEQNALQQDSTVFYTNSDTHNAYRNLLVRQSQDRVIKSTTLVPGYQNILFSFFRLNFTVLIAGFVVLMLVRWIKTRRISLFTNNERFQYRILDSFLLATLAFSILLVFVTHFAIKEQNTELAEQQLFEKLEPITNATEKNPAIFKQIKPQLNASLDSLTAPLNVDASFYKGRLISESTTPQIYQQHLLPSALPYPVYSDLFLSQKRDALTKVMLDGQELFIGYRSVLSDDNTPVAAIAIPTFVQSPKFNQQLLQTTSFLIILYLVIFGLFIIGTTIISRQLTRPLDYIQEGLNKISKGNLDTTIPVTSDDEIGSLARAYNRMVSRLKELQGELAAAEREEAWKEMAQQVAHEIKNPLTPMKLNIQHLQRQMASGNYTIKELREKVKTITENLIVQIQSLNNIASDFSKFSKPINEEFTQVNINELVGSVVDLYNVDDHVTINVDQSALRDTVYGARDELRRVIINLVKNAHESMPDGEGIIELKTYVREDSIFIEVEDNGEGISEEDKPKIFVPNFSTKSSGTGLGLAICRKVVEAHNGSISFASIKEKGTTFVIKIPLYQN